MFCTCWMVLLLSSLSVLQIFTSPAEAQRELGFIVEAPVPATVPLGSIANFSCTAVGIVFWEVNGLQVQNEGNVDVYANVDIFVPLPTPNHSMIVINVTTANNGSNMTCLVEEEGDIRILNRSDVVRLIAYGEPSPPLELNVTVPSHGLGVWLTWKRGFSFQGEQVKFVIISQDISSGLQTENCTNLTSIMLPPFAASEDRCLLYNFTVFSENSFSRSSSVVTENALLPAVPIDLERVDVTVSFQDASSVEIQFAFEAPSPCAEFSVTAYTVLFIEINNSMISSTFNVSRPNSDSHVSLSVTDSDGILLSRLYNFTMIAHNSAGSSAFVGSFYTTGLQSSRVVADQFSASVTCKFAAGALAVGCHVLFGSVFQFNISRDPGSDIVMDNVTFPEELRNSLLFEMVAVSEILADGSVSPVFLQPMVIIMVTETTTIPSNISTTTSKTEQYTTATVTFSATVTLMPTTNVTTEDDSLLSGSTLYIVVGAIAAVILVLLLIIIVVVCFIRSSHQRNKNRRSIEQSNLEELKPNYMYGNRGPSNIASTDLVGLENTRQARSNTYDDPRSDLAAGNGAAVPAIPTYETIQSAKNGMLIAGAPVLNPVYGPTGTPNTPTSPRLPPHKAASNPVYAESGIPQQQFSDVSALNPVYAPVGKQTQPEPLSPPVDQRYANAQMSQPAASIKEHDNSATLAAPMYEELRAATKRSSGNLVGGAMTKNESYGLIRTENVQMSNENGMNNQSVEK